jgi:catechol 2,3-dioxygenase-like lactoylglutathione lyase family enzyme
MVRVHIHLKATDLN